MFPFFCKITNFPDNPQTHSKTRKDGQILKMLSTIAESLFSIRKVGNSFNNESVSHHHAGKGHHVVYIYYAVAVDVGYRKVYPFT